MMLESVRNFKVGHRNLSNIFKFANEGVLTKLQDYVKHC
jgi:hypothetical protein